MDYHGALGVLRTIIKERPDAILVNEGANTLDLARGVIDMYKPRKRLDVGTWGVMGIGMGSAIAAAVETGKPVLAVEGDSAFGFSGMEVETICRYKLPVCVVIFNNDGIYRGTDVNTGGGSDPAPTVFVKGARYDKMMEAFGGVGVNATTPDELKRAVNAAMDFAQADPDQRGDRSGGRQRERPHRQPQSAKQAAARSRSFATTIGHSSDRRRDMAKKKKAAKAKGKARLPRRRARPAKKPVLKVVAKKANGNGLPKVRPSPGARTARRSTASKSSTSRTSSRARPARSCWPGSAPT